MIQATTPAQMRPMLQYNECEVLVKFSMPKDKPVIAITRRKNPQKSKRGTVGSVTFGMALKVMRQPKTPIGILIRKIQCQVVTSTNQPPNVGPMSGPIKPARLIRLIADKNCARGITLSMAKRPTGRSNAPPMPCKTR